MGPTEPLELTLPAVSSSVPRARAAVTAYARLLGVAGERLEDLRLIVSEAVTNAVLHAYDDEGGVVRLTVARADGPAGADGGLWLLIEDHGLGLRSGRSSPGLGLGLGLIERFGDDLALERRVDGGTLLSVRFSLDGSERSRQVGDRGRSDSRALEPLQAGQVRG